MIPAKSTLEHALGIPPFGPERVESDLARLRGRLTRVERAHYRRGILLLAGLLVGLAAWALTLFVDKRLDHTGFWTDFENGMPVSASMIPLPGDRSVTPGMAIVAKQVLLVLRLFMPALICGLAVAYGFWLSHRRDWNLRRLLGPSPYPARAQRRVRLALASALATMLVMWSGAAWLSLNFPDLTTNPTTPKLNIMYYHGLGGLGFIRDQLDGLWWLPTVTRTLTLLIPLIIALLAARFLRRRHKRHAAAERAPGDAKEDA